MNARLASLAPLFVAAAASVAHAQAPGELVAQPVADAPDDGDATDEAPAPAAQVVVAAPAMVAPVMAAPVMAGPAGAPCGVVRVARRESVMNNRWSVGLSLGSMSLTPDGSSDKTSFAVGELALRFRLTPHFELEASAGGGREQLDNGDQGDLEVNTAALALRYRFNPEGKWNWFVMGGVGAASVTLHDATDTERNNATHPMAMLGVGVERRFHNFALQAELRGVGISDKSKDDQMAPVETPAMAGLTGGTGGTTTDAAAVKQSGGSLTIGASYYF